MKRTISFFLLVSLIIHIAEHCTYEIKSIGKYEI